ncbi:DoxX family protein [Nesterenkonia lutea]|uniref:Membrane protein YphA (DoxX/SURF4 family) n=1 Tax=Nesterenkonia lutea TaxID=272919 RepID=A0ABR9JEC2_9MICC|nr:DoxX family protein [Nesterenkonia lutea]MBE1524264.1 putative membrane protein YphA (DoxX/SURF4 family) [Nesterenkonia lutea]
MSLLRKFARPLLGASFIATGVDRLRNTDDASARIESTLEEIGSMVPQAEPLVSNAKLTTQVLGGVEIAAGLALSTGRFSRAAALTLACVHKFDSYAEYRNAEVESDSDVTAQRSTLLKNLSILGGLGLAIVDLDGKPSLGWRAEHLAKATRKKGAKLSDKTSAWADDLGSGTNKKVRGFEKNAKKNLNNASKGKKKKAQLARKKLGV